jgi:hypothetical protein
MMHVIHLQRAAETQLAFSNSYKSSAVTVSGLFIRKYQAEVLVISVDLNQSCSLVREETHHPWKNLHKDS